MRKLLLWAMIICYWGDSPLDDALCLKGCGTDEAPAYSTHGELCPPGSPKKHCVLQFKSIEHGRWIRVYRPLCIVDES